MGWVRLTGGRLGAPQTGRLTWIGGVIRHKRRRYYGHAASLARACLQVEPGEETQAWFSAIEQIYRRYPAFQRELRGGIDGFGPK